MSSGAEEKIRVRVDDELEFLMTQEQLRLMEIKEGDSFYSCVTTCNEDSFEEFDSAMSLNVDHAESSFTQAYEDITPVPSESETTPTTSFTEGMSGVGRQEASKFPTPSPRKLEAIAILSARFNLIHPPRIEITSAGHDKDTSTDDVSQPSDVFENNPGTLENPTGVFESAIHNAGRNVTKPISEARVSGHSADDNKAPAPSCDERRHLRVEPEKFTAKAIRPPTKNSATKENCERNPTSANHSDAKGHLDASLDINIMSSRLMKNPRQKKLQEQSFKGSPVHLSKLRTPNKSKATSKVAEFIRSGMPSAEKRGKDTPSLKTVPSASRIPRKCFIQSARVFGKQVVPDNLMKSPKPVITIHKHTGSDKTRQIHINESVYETFEAEAVKKC